MPVKTEETLWSTCKEYNDYEVICMLETKKKFEVIVLFFFFFSSRRRHTRCSRDWSSDVVLFRSLLVGEAAACLGDLHLDEILVEVQVPKASGGFAYQKFNKRGQDWAIVGVAAVRLNRSEERRVGQECGEQGTESHVQGRKDH